MKDLITILSKKSSILKMLVFFNQFHRIYISNDGGISFQKLMPQISQIGGLRLVLSFPEYRRLIVFNGNDTLVLQNASDINR